MLIATQPAFITFSRSSMSDLSGGAFAVLAFALVYLGLAWRRRLLIYCLPSSSACLCAYGHSYYSSRRYYLLWLSFRLRFLDEVVHALLPCPCSIRVGREPVLYSEHFGIWPSVKDRLRILGALLSKTAFSLHNVPAQVALIWSEITASWDQFRVANLFGTGIT